MTQRTIMRCALGGAAAIAFLATPTSVAFAQDNAAEDAIRTNLHREILVASAEEPREESRWFSRNFHLHEKSGFAYTRRLTMANKPFVFRVQGPVLGKQEAVGLAIKITF
jgi:hypothetical protein